MSAYCHLLTRVLLGIVQVVQHTRLTARLWVSTKWRDDALVLCCRVLNVCTEVTNIAELRIVKVENSATTDALQRGKIYFP